MEAQAKLKTTEIPTGVSETGVLAGFWMWLVQVHPSIENEEDRSRSRLLAAILFLLMTLGLPLITYYVAISNFTALYDTDTVLALIGVLVLTVMYFLNRRGKVNIAAVGLIAATSLVFLIGPYTPGARIPILYYSILTVLLTAIFFSPRRVVLVAAIVATTSITLAYLVDYVDPAEQTDITLFLIFSSAVVVVFINHYRRIEGIRRSALETANEQLRESEALLERRVAERTHDLELARVEAEQARLLAETANQTKSRFLANMSHELRTPLNAVLNFTAFVADGVLGNVNGEQVDALNQATSSGKHLLSLINDVLDITKIESGMMDLFIQEVDYNEIMASAVSVSKGLVKDKPIVLDVKIDADLPRTFGDKRRLRQVMLNLVSNAVKFTNEGTLSIEASRKRDGVQIAVKDTGLGIRPEEQHLVFEAFRQAKHDLAGAVGTGLGMPISKYFVESHGGEIWFESEVGKGTTFTVYLPVLSEEAASVLNQLETKMG